MVVQVVADIFVVVLDMLVLVDPPALEEDYNTEIMCLIPIIVVDDIIYLTELHHTTQVNHM